MYVALHPFHVNLYTRSEHNPNGVGDLLQNTFWILYVCDIIFKLAIFQWIFAVKSVFLSAKTVLLIF